MMNRTKLALVQVKKTEVVKYYGSRPLKLNKSAQGGKHLNLLTIKSEERKV